ncbi:NAD(P)/FAD-dependent oxidoreductase [Fulvivirgaceae bacterium BMA12]|uniref:NAD(P)/FAD-dependent oxidoreductase n=1 Tax=Agaribacillus aureus TaxID=3051825 RepID=A0ABT8L5Z3_9BACT|nr:NAD(P)/FAD-dependent oxidoreductase [Fulvivirgaceae bacterium BMA12]
METTNTIIIGASAAGLACAAQLEKRGISYKIIEKHSHVAHAWRNHYDRLHLHTHKHASDLPFVKFPKKTPKYPAKHKVVQYLENYCNTLGIRPSFNVKAAKIQKVDDTWVIHTNNGTIKSNNVIICTGNTNRPKKYTKTGLESFSGTILHSSEYKNGQVFKGKKVLVVGFGNSAGEIAMCLHEHGAKPTLSVRSPVNIIPRDILGIPVLQISI